MMKKNQGRKALSPMGLDANMGAIRAIYPIKGALCFLHGSTGCSFYPRFVFSWHNNYQVFMLSTGIEKKHVIFGGEGVLEEGLEKAVEVMRPELIVIQNTCIPALIGDDAEGIARKVQEKTGVRIISTTNPNYRGNQLGGYHNVVNKYISELMKNPREVKKNSVNLLGIMPGEFNWVNDLKEIKRILMGLGLSVNCVLIGDNATVQDLIHAPQAEANILVYPEVGLPAAQLMQNTFGTPYIKTSFPPLGIESTQEWIYQIAEFFDICDRARAFIDQEMMALGGAISQLEEGQIYNFQTLFGKTYAIEGSSFSLPAMVKFLYEDVSLTPTTIAFQEEDPQSLDRLNEVLKEYNLSTEVQPIGDNLDFLDSITRNHVYPNGDPWMVFGSTIDALQLAFKGHRLPVIRFSYPVLDESIITDQPFLGFRGVVFLIQRIHNTFVEKVCFTRYAIGHIPDPYEMAEMLDKSLLGKEEKS